VFDLKTLDYSINRRVGFAMRRVMFLETLLSSKILLPLFLGLLLANPLPALRAAITSTGNVSPSNPSSWTSSTHGYVGNSAATGSLTVDGNSNLLSSQIDIGYRTGATGFVIVTGGEAKWTNSNIIGIGDYGGAGTLTVTGGASVSSYNTIVGWIYSGSMGVINVDGAGSKLTGYQLSVGNDGTGMLNISHGATVTMTDRTYVAANNGSTGTINFGDGGGTLTTNTLLASPDQLTGTGMIHTQGLVSDMDLVFDSAPSLNRMITLANGSGQNIILDLDMSNSTNVGWLGAGYRASGSLTVKNGVVVHSKTGYLGDLTGSTGIATVTGTGSIWEFEGYMVDVGNWGNGVLKVANGGSVHGSVALGYCSGSTGVLTVDGAGSTWCTSADAAIGVSGQGTLNVTNGGTVNTRAPNGSLLAQDSTSTGIVRVDGAGSNWTNGGFIYIGANGSGTLLATGGGAVSASGISLNSTSLMAIDVGRGSLLKVNNGSGTITNNGNIRIFAGAGIVAGKTYSPISAGTWSGAGTCQSVGGTWSAGSHQFTVSAFQSGQSGTPVGIDLAMTQRVLITDNVSGWTVGASFLAKSTTTPLTFTATAANDGTLTALGNKLGSGQSVFGAWSFTSAGGYAAGDPAYLSFGVGAGRPTDSLIVWHYDGNNWTPFNANDLTYDGNYASFTATDLSGFAVTGIVVPEPSTFALLGIGTISLLAYAWRCRKYGV
jgi:T5SS/PEP-CTERM-associated repeat protein